MFAALLLEYHLAFVFLSALVIGAAVPLAVAWARVLPEEPPPFQIQRPTRRRRSIYAHSSDEEEASRDPLAIVLLLCVTASFAAQLPGLSQNLGLGSIPTLVPNNASGWIQFALTWVLMVVPGFAAAYSILRQNFLRVPLIAASALVLLLWLLSTPLRAALEAVN